MALKENKHLRAAVRGYEYVVRRDSAALAAKDTVVVATERQLVVAKVLGRDAENRAGLWRRKAHTRFWVAVGEAALLVGTLLLAVGR